VHARPTPGDPVVVDYRKWLDRQHHRFAARALGDDRHGTWLAIPAGTPLTGGPRTGTFRRTSVVLVPSGGWWTAEFSSPDEELPLYLDVCTPPLLTRDHLLMVDLDLDVLRSRDGTTWLEDREEFELHRSELGYPRWLAEGAARAAELLLESVRSGREPFGRASEPWLARAERL
jgi:hypothetical protein